MTAADPSNVEAKFEPLKQDLELKKLPGKKIYHSDRYIYLDKSEFNIVWHNVGLFIFLHYYWLRGLYGIVTLDPDFIKCVPITLIWTLFCGFGVTAGAHRLWAHRTYKARLPLRIFLMFCHIIAGENNIYVWARDHRLHHKYSDTDADPHNTNRGFFFAHMGWLMFKKHPDVLVKGSKIDMKDLKQDPLIKFQIKYYYILFTLASVYLPMFLSMYCFGASLYGAFLYSFMVRYAGVLHSTWFVNSAAHMFGEKPYDAKIRPVENMFVTFFSVGEGYHNYHHKFPFDYATGEFTNYNLAKKFIDFMAKHGLAYDRKRASKQMVDNSKMKNIQRSLYKVDREDEDENNNYTFVENDEVNLKNESVDINDNHQKLNGIKRSNGHQSCNGYLNNHHVVNGNNELKIR